MNEHLGHAVPEQRPGKADVYIFTDEDEMKCEMKGARKEYDYVSVDAFWIKRSRKTKEQV